MSKDKENPEKEVTKSPEVVAIEKKLEDIRVEHVSKSKEKNDLIQKIRKLDEELIKLIGAYQKLQEVKNELMGPVDEDPEKECCEEDCNCENTEEATKEEEKSE